MRVDELSRDGAVRRSRAPAAADELSTRRAFLGGRVRPPAAADERSDATVAVPGGRRAACGAGWSRRDATGSPAVGCGQTSAAVSCPTRRGIRRAAARAACCRLTTSDATCGSGDQPAGGTLDYAVRVICPAASTGGATSAR